MGTAGARVGPNYVIPQSAGRLQGNNLFHSFSRFSIQQGESATFTSAGDVPIRNVIARVTGGQPSTINGLLRSAVPDANLYLINPSGIVFGPEASLDVQGSFVATTAAYVKFADGARFPGTTDGTTPVLTSAAPSAFGFLTPRGVTAGGITYNGVEASSAKPARLQVPDGAGLALIGGPVEISGGQLLSKAGQVHVASVVGTGEIALDISRADAVPTLVPRTSLGPVALTNGTAVSTTDAGRITIRAGDLRIDRSEVKADIDDIDGRGIDILSTGTMNVLSGGISSITLGTGNSGSISIDAGTLHVSGLFPRDGSGAPITASTALESLGRGGDIRIKAKDFTLDAAGSVEAIANASGRGGDITVDVGRLFRIDGGTTTFLTGLTAETTSFQNGGRGGDITVSARHVELLRQGQVSSTTKGSGASGVMKIIAQSLLLDGQDSPQQTLLEARVGKGGGIGATGAGGAIDLDVRDITLRRGGVISASTFGAGTGGDVIIRNADRLRIEGSAGSQFTGIFARSSPADDTNVAGPGGKLQIDARTIRVTGVRTADPILGSGAISSESTPNPSGLAGPAGAVTINAQDVTVSGNARLAVSAPTASGGDLVVRTGTLTLLGDHVPTENEINDPKGGFGQMNASAAQTGGNITLLASESIILRNALITARALGDGGRILVDPPAVVLDSSFINGLAGGTPVIVRIDAAGFFKSPDSDVLTNRPIDLPQTDISGAFLPVRADLLGGMTRLIPSCQTTGDQTISRFNITGRGGAALEPGELQTEWILTPVR